MKWLVYKNHHYLCHVISTIAQLVASQHPNTTIQKDYSCIIIIHVIDDSTFFKMMEDYQIKLHEELTEPESADLEDRILYQQELEWG